MKQSRFFPQAELLLRSLPHVAAERCFALKGGTAINFFVRDMPRLSVDIDLVYLPIQPRETSLREIGEALQRIARGIQRTLANIEIHEVRTQDSDHVIRLIVRQQGAQIKIEPNLVIRGTVFPGDTRDLVAAAEELFELAVSTTVVSIADLYAGKICAALDRQHPRDLFDVNLLLDDGPISDEVRRAFVVYLASHRRPMSELLDPILKDVRLLFEEELVGLIHEPVGYDQLVDTRQQLVDTMRSGLTSNEREFLISVQSGTPQWELLELAGLDKLPALQWKIVNVRKMDEHKLAEAVRKLRDMLGC